MNQRADSAPRTKCTICENPECLGFDKLREFNSWSDLTSHAGEVEIVRWVNELAKHKERQAYQSKKYHTARRELMKVAKQMLSPDELAEIERQAKEAAADSFAGEGGDV